MASNAFNPNQIGAGVMPNGLVPHPESMVGGTTFGSGMGAPTDMATGGSIKPSDWAMWFGDAPRPIQSSPYDMFQRENFALPEVCLSFAQT